MILVIYVFAHKCIQCSQQGPVFCLWRKCGDSYLESDNNIDVLEVQQGN